jgi:hypothetical protein
MPYISICPEWFPLWYTCGILTYGNSALYLLSSIATFVFFIRYEIKINIEEKEFIEIIKKTILTTLISLIFKLIITLFNLTVNLRDIAQDHSLNIVYSMAKIIIVIYYFGLLSTGKITHIIMLILVGGFNAISGSKASMLVPILIIIMLYKPNIKNNLILIVTALIGCLIFIPFDYLVRYADVGLSAYQTAYIYQLTEIDLISFYIKTISNFLNGIKGFNPVVEYLNVTNVAPGYNLTPTIVGEIMGSGVTTGFAILFLLFTITFAIRKFILHFLSYREYLAWFFVLLGTFQSSLLDVIFYNLYFFISLLIVKFFNIFFSVKIIIFRKHSL